MFIIYHHSNVGNIITMNWLDKSFYAYNFISVIWNEKKRKFSELCKEKKIYRSIKTAGYFLHISATFNNRGVARKKRGNSKKKFISQEKNCPNIIQSSLSSSHSTQHNTKISSKTMKYKIK